MCAEKSLHQEELNGIIQKKMSDYIRKERIKMRSQKSKQHLNIEFSEKEHQEDNDNRLEAMQIRQLIDKEEKKHQNENKTVKFKLIIYSVFNLLSPTFMFLISFISNEWIIAGPLLALLNTWSWTILIDYEIKKLMIEVPKETRAEFTTTSILSFSFLFGFLLNVQLVKTDVNQFQINSYILISMLFVVSIVTTIINLDLWKSSVRALHRVKEEQAKQEPTDDDEDPLISNDGYTMSSESEISGTMENKGEKDKKEAKGNEIGK